MPSSMTHTYFGLDVYNKLNSTCQNKIKDNKEYFKLFCQGSDPFMFYNFFIGKKSLAMKKLQHIMHTSKTRELFITIIKYIHDNKLADNSDVMAYLYGYICHYFLDLYAHPFIEYKSGIFNKNDKNTHKYNGMHAKIEYAIDMYLIEKKDGIDAKDFKTYKKIFNVNKLTPILKNIIKNSIGIVYSIDKVDKIYESSINNMKLFFRLANYDPYGFKLKIYNIIDKITPNNIIKVKELSYSNKYDDINSYLNLDNNIWYYPWDNTIEHTSSFLDLYEIALDKCVKTIEEVTNLLDCNNLNIKQFKRLFKDLSYVTGLECNKEISYKYFEF